MSETPILGPRGRRVAKKRPRARAKGAVTASPRTVAFKAKIQKTLALSGVEVNRNLAWQIFKDLFYATVEFTVNDPEKRLPLSGVGTFSIRESAPRKGKAEEYAFIPRYKIKPSSRIQAMLEKIMPECRLDYADGTDPAEEAPEVAVKTKKKGPKKKAKKSAPKEEAVMEAPLDDDEDLLNIDDALLDDDLEEDIPAAAETKPLSAVSKPKSAIDDLLEDDEDPDDPDTEIDDDDFSFEA